MAKFILKTNTILNVEWFQDFNDDFPVSNLAYYTNDGTDTTFFFTVDVTPTIEAELDNLILNNDPLYIRSPSADQEEVIVKVNGIVADELGELNLTPDEIDDSNSTNKFVTDSEKTILSNTSGTNTGDEDTASIQAKRPLKTVSGQSIEGSGDIVFPSSGVQSVTGDGVGGTATDPVVSFPNSDEIDDSGLNKFVTQTQLNIIDDQSGVNTGDETDASIKSKYENNADTNAFTDSEKTKLSGLESSKFVGQFTSLSALQTAFPAAEIGSYAYVDAGIGQDVELYIWDNDDTSWILQQGESTAETPASIKSKYESNADTNAFTDTEKNKLADQSGVNTGDETDASIKSKYENNADTNSFTDSEKLNLSNQSNVNTGDEDTTSIQTKRPLKTIEGESLEGSGDIVLPSNGVQSVTGDGVSGTATDPVLSFPNSDEVDDSGLNKFVSQAQLDIIDDQSGTNTGDETAASIKIKYESNSNTNAFTDAEQTNLSNQSGINTGDETDASIKSKYENNADTNAFTDSEKLNLSNQTGTNTGDETTSSIQSKRQLKTIGGESLEGSGDITLPNSGVQSVTGDGVSGTATDPVLTFPTADQINDSGSNKFVTQTQIDIIDDQSGTNTGDETTSSIQSKRPLKTVGGNSIEGSGDITLPSSGVQSVTGDGVSGTATDPVLSFPNSDEVDDSGINKFVSQAQLDIIGDQSGVNTGDETAATIKTKYESNSNTNAFTDAEKNKLADLESSKFVGEFISLAALQTAFPTSDVGSYAYVDAGIGQDVEKYIWDDSDVQWVIQQGQSTAETPATIKSKYESNADTNAFTDAEKDKLADQSGINTGDETLASLQTKRPLRTIDGEAIDVGTENISIGVIEVIGDGVGGTLAEPVISFPDADEVDDDNTTNKFATQPQLDQIASNTVDISDNSLDIIDLQTNKGDMFKSIYDTDDDGIVDRAESVVFKAELNQTAAKGNLLYGIGRNAITGNPVAGLADNTVSFADKTVGMALQSGNSGDVIEVVKIGVIEDLDTSAFAVGETVYLSTFGTFNKKSNITSGIFNPIGYVVKSAFVDGSIIIDTSANESINTDNTINNSSVPGRTSTDALNNLLNNSGGGVQTVTGDGVGGTATDPVLSFPNSDEIDDSGTNKFVTDSDLTIIANQSGVNTGDETAATIKTKYESNSDTNAFTDSEKSKLAGLESSKFVGEFISLSALQTAFPTATVGSYAYVDAGVGQPVEKYIWDNTDSDWELQQGESTTETPASIKTKYESNADTNAFTDSEKTLLSDQSGVNTGDEDISSIQTKRPLKTFSGDSLEGTGDILYKISTDSDNQLSLGTDNLIYLEAGIPDSLSIDLRWRFNNSTAATDPNSNNFRLNNTDTALVTEIYVSEVAFFGRNVANILEIFKSGDRVYIQQTNSEGIYINCNISSDPIDNGTYWTIPVTTFDSGSVFGNNSTCNFIIYHVGFSGETGVQTVTGDGVSGTPDDVILSFPTPTDIGAAEATDLDNKLDKPIGTDFERDILIRSTSTGDYESYTPVNGAVKLNNVLQGTVVTRTSTVSIDLSDGTESFSSINNFPKNFSNQFPSQTPASDPATFIPGIYNSVDGQWLENSIDQQVHNWRITIDYSREAGNQGQTNNREIIVTLQNPLTSFVQRRIYIMPGGADFRDNVANIEFVTVADSSSIGTGYEFLLQVSDQSGSEITVNKLDILRISQEKI